MMPSFPKIKPVRSEPYRRLVAALPCVSCGVHGYSNHAHANTGKGKGVKADDRQAFPLCVDRVGKAGCHTQHDQRRMFAKHDDEVYREVEEMWVKLTHQMLRSQAKHDPAAAKVVEKTIGGLYE